MKRFFVGFFNPDAAGAEDVFSRCRRPVLAAMRMILGWHLAYLGIWALTSEWDYSWVGCFRCAKWIFADTFRAVGASGAMGAVDAGFAWGLLVSGILLMTGRLVRPAALFGVMYLALMYVLNPPHFGHTGESHFMFLDRNVIEICMLFLVMAEHGHGTGKDEPAQKEAAA